MTRISKQWLPIAAAMLVAASAQAQAQRYPEKQITFVVPFAAGASTDLGARALARAVSEDVKQTIIVENKPGVDGLVGVQAFARMPADGYSILVSSSSTHVLNQHLYKSLPYDPVKDFIPVAMLYRGIQLIVVKGDSPIKSLQDLIDRAKANPGKLSFGASTATTRLAVEMFKQFSGTQFLYVPYKGVAPYLADLMSGTIDIASADVQSLRPLIEAGKLRALGVTSRNRHFLLPNVPSMDESGLKGLEFTYYAGVWLPAGTPAAIVNRVHDFTYKAVKSPVLSKFFTDSGAEIIELSLAEMAAHQAADIERLGKVVKGAGIQPQ